MSLGASSSPTLPARAGLVMEGGVKQATRLCSGVHEESIVSVGRGWAEGLAVRAGCHGTVLRWRRRRKHGQLHRYVHRQSYRERDCDRDCERDEQAVEGSAPGTAYGSESKQSSINRA